MGEILTGAWWERRPRQLLLHPCSRRREWSCQAHSAGRFTQLEGVNCELHRKSPLTLAYNQSHVKSIIGNLLCLHVLNISPAGCATTSAGPISN